MILKRLNKLKNSDLDKEMFRKPNGFRPLSLRPVSKVEEWALKELSKLPHPVYDYSIPSLISSLINGSRKRSIVNDPHYSSNMEPLLPLDYLRSFDNILLIVIDGLGFNWLKDHSEVLVDGSPSVLANNLVAGLSSVFFSTTTAAMTSYYTGLFPREHGLIGWHTYFKELGAIYRSLDSTPRSLVCSLPALCYPFRPEDLFQFSSFKSKVTDRDLIFVNNSSYLSSLYNHLLMNNSFVFGYEDGSLDSFFKAMRLSLSKRIKKKDSEEGKNKKGEELKNNNSRRLVLAYWPLFDGLEHLYGPDSPIVLEHFKELERGFRSFLASLRRSKKIGSTLVLISADHGHNFVPPGNKIDLNEYPEIYDLLAMPLSGDSRACFAFLKNDGLKKSSSKKDDIALRFEKLVKSRLGHAIIPVRSDRLLELGYFGPSKKGVIDHPRLLDRIGDFVLVARPGFAIGDLILGEEGSSHLGRHSGLTLDELLIPLISFAIEKPKRS